MKRLLAVTLAVFLFAACSSNNNPKPSVVSTNSAPSSFSLLYPADGSSVTIDSVVLKWQPATDPDGDPLTYDVYISVNDGQFEEFASGISSTSLTIAEPVPHGRYAWYVEAVDPKGARSVSQTWHFTIANSPPSEFSLVSPADDSRVNPANLELRWNEPRDPDGDTLEYEIYLSVNNGDFYMAAITDITSFRLDEITPHATYVWYVIAKDGYGGEVSSSQSSFSLLNRAPEIPILTSPANGVTTSGVDILFGWNESKDPDGDSVSYDLYFSRDGNSFEKLFSALTVTSAEIEMPLSSDRTYYWYVEAHDSFGATATSETWSFEVPNLLPEPVYVSPTTFTGRTFPLLWWKFRDLNGDPITTAVFVGASPSALQYVKTSNEYGYYRITDPVVTHFYWKVVARDDKGGEFSTPVYSVSVTPSELGAGFFHACAVDMNHRMWCWGENTQGQLGNNSTQDSNHKVQVDGTQVWEKTASQWVNSFGIDDQGVLWGWGSNQFYGLSSTSGTYSTNYRTLTPIVLEDSEFFVDVDAQHLTQCALTVDGKLYCWGQNYEGQVGVGYTSDYVKSMQEVRNSAGWLVVSVGRNHTCAIDKNLQLWCWGYNSRGQLGNGSTVDEPSPVKVKSPDNVLWKDVSAGYYHTCGIDLDGNMWCWGDNQYGELGLGDSYGVTSLPRKVVGGLKWEKVTAGNNWTCGITSGNEIYCWGVNSGGMLGIGYSSYQENYPHKISSSNYEKWVNVDAGDMYTCAYDLDNRVFCWGKNDTLALGIGYDFIKFYPVEVSNSAGWKMLAYSSDSYNMCAIDANDKLYCWGYNGRHELPTGDTLDRQLPIVVEFGEPVTITKVDLTFNHSCALDGSGRLWCWGSNYGKIWDSTYDYPRVITENVRDFDIAPYHICVINTSNDLYCWGDNYYGELGVGSSLTISSTPLLVENDMGTKWRSVDVSANFTCAIDLSGHLWCWGQNDYGQVGNGTTDNQYYPTLINNSDNSAWKLVKTSSRYTCAIDVNDNLWCWGYNYYGQLGTGDRSNWSTPVKIINDDGTGWLDVSLGSNYGSNAHTCGIDMNGALWCWGDNYYGEYGETGINLSPGKITAFGPIVSQVTAMTYGTCVLVSNKLYCAGSEAYGELGDGESWFEYPVETTTVAR